MVPRVVAVFDLDNRRRRSMLARNIGSSPVVVMAMDRGGNSRYQAMFEEGVDVWMMVSKVGADVGIAGVVALDASARSVAEIPSYRIHLVQLASDHRVLL